MDQGVARPAWAEHVGAVEAAECYLNSDAYGDRDEVVCVFSYAGQEQHALVVIVDYNGIQSLGMVKDVIDMHPFADKWRAFRWSVRELNGHDMAELERALTQVPFEAGRPSCIIAHTVKGKGVSYMENKLLWHYRAPLGEDQIKALAELEQCK